MEHRIQLKSGWIRYLDTGGAQSKVIVLIHGNSSCSDSFLNQLESSLTQEYRLIALDLPGHGGSAPLKAGSYSLPAFAQTLVEFVQTLNLPPAVFVGQSLGGHVLLEAVAELTPWIRGLVIQGTPPLGKPPQFAEAFQPHPVGAYLFKKDVSLEEIQELNRAMQATENSAHSAQLTVDFLKADPQLRADIGLSVAQLNYADELEAIQSLTCPIAIFHGSEERLVSKPYLDAMHLPNLWKGSVQVIPQVGHLSYLENAGQFNSMLGAFAQEC